MGFSQPHTIAKTGRDENVSMDTGQNLQAF